MRRPGSALDRLLEARRPQARSLVVSVFGDVVAVHGGVVWLGTLVRWLALFGIAERNTRTAVTRLVNEGWLERTPVGRRSDLMLGELGRHRTREAERRIYAPAPRPWKDTWSLVLLGHCGLAAAERDRVARELGLLGFGELSPGTFAHPSADLEELELVLHENGLGARAVVLAATSRRVGIAKPETALGEVVANAWDLDDLASQYSAFSRRFGALGTRLARGAEPQLAFCIRVLAIHEYRRIVLRDPGLPAELLPADWPGARARELLAALYRQAAGASSEWIRETGETACGGLPAAGAAFRRRFRQSG